MAVDTRSANRFADSGAVAAQPATTGADRPTSCQVPGSREPVDQALAEDTAEAPPLSPVSAFGTVSPTPYGVISGFGFLDP